MIEEHKPDELYRVKIKDLRVVDHMHRVEYEVNYHPESFDFIIMRCLRPNFWLQTQTWQADTFRKFVRNGSIERLFKW